VGSASGSGRLPKNPPIDHELLVTLKDIANGCIKSLKISQVRISASAFQGRGTAPLEEQVAPQRPYCRNLHQVSGYHFKEGHIIDSLPC